MQRKLGGAAQTFGVAEVGQYSQLNRQAETLMTSIAEGNGVSLEHCRKLVQEEEHELPPYMLEYLKNFLSTVMGMKKKAAEEYTPALKAQATFLFGNDIFIPQELTFILADLLNPTRMRMFSRTSIDSWSEEANKMLHHYVLKAVLDRAFPQFTKEKLTDRALLHLMLKGIFPISTIDTGAHGCTTDFKMPEATSALHDIYHWGRRVSTLYSAMSQYVQDCVESLKENPEFNLEKAIKDKVLDASQKWDSFMDSAQGYLGNQDAEAVLYYGLHELYSVISSDLLRTPTVKQFFENFCREMKLQAETLNNHGKEPTLHAPSDLKTGEVPNLSDLWVKCNVICKDHFKALQHLPALMGKVEDVLNMFENVQDIKLPIDVWENFVCMQHEIFSQYCLDNLALFYQMWLRFVRVEVKVTMVNPLFIGVKVYDPVKDVGMIGDQRERFIPTSLWMRRMLYDSAATLEGTSHSVEKPTFDVVNTESLLFEAQKRHLANLTLCAETVLSNLQSSS